MLNKVTFVGFTGGGGGRRGIGYLQVILDEVYMRDETKTLITVWRPSFPGLP